MLNSFNNFLLNSTAGLIPGTQTITIYGRNVDVDNNTVPESITTQGGLSTSFINTYGIVTLASSSVLDTIAGTGSRVVKIEGLGVNFEPISEILELNGLTLVNSVNSYSRINRLAIVSAGSLGKNQGIITARSSIAGTPIMKQVNIGNNLSSDLTYTVPTGYTAFITGYMVNINKSTGNSSTQQSDLGIFIKYFGLQIWWNLYQISASQGSIHENELSIPIKIEEKTDIDIRVTASDDNTDVSAALSLILIENTQLV